MKVAIVAYGHADNVICLAKNLSQRADVTVVFVTAGKRFRRSIVDWDLSRIPYGITTDRDTVASYLGDSILGYIASSVKVYIARTPSLKLLKDWQRKNLRYIWEISKFLKAQNYDVIHFNGFSGFQLYFHAFLPSVAKVYTIHDYVPHSGEWKAIPIVLNRLYTKLNYQFIQHHACLSKKFSEYYGVRPERVHTVYSGSLDVYRTFVNRPRNEEPSTILFFGRISKYKGIDYLVQAASRIKARVSDLKIIIAGKGDLQLKFRDERTFEIHNYHIPNDELVNLIQRASIVVAPYTDATHSGVIMTAFAFNKPVVASAVGGIPEVVEDGVTGMLVPPRQSRELARAIVTLLTDHALRRKIVRNINRVSRSGKLSWDNIAQRTIEVYEQASCDVKKK